MKQLLKDTSLLITCTVNGTTIGSWIHKVKLTQLRTSSPGVLTLSGFSLDPEAKILLRNISLTDTIYFGIYSEDSKGQRFGFGPLTGEALMSNPKIKIEKLPSIDIVNLIEKQLCDAIQSISNITNL